MAALRKEVVKVNDIGKIELAEDLGVKMQEAAAAVGDDGGGVATPASISLPSIAVVTFRGPDRETEREKERQR